MLVQVERMEDGGMGSFPEGAIPPMTGRSDASTNRVAVTPAREVNRTLLSLNLAALLPLDRSWHHSCTHAAYWSIRTCLKGIQLYRALIVITFAATLAACGKGPEGAKGDPGPEGPPGARGEAGP